jgi:hypothetical protein
LGDAAVYASISRRFSGFIDHLSEQVSVVLVDDICGWLAVLNEIKRSEYLSMNVDPG